MTTNQPGSFIEFETLKERTSILIELENNKNMADLINDINHYKEKNINDPESQRKCNHLLNLLNK